MAFKFNPITNKLDIVGDSNVSGDVTGPGSSTDRAIARWDGTTGTQLLDSSVIVTDAGIVQALGLELTTPLNEIYGGTGQIGYSTGDLIYADSATTLATLPISTDGKVLEISGGLPTWQTPAPGGVTSVNGTANRITSTGGTTPVIDIAATYIGQTSITTLGTIATGTWNATTIATTVGGTGLTSYAQGDLIYSSTVNTLSTLAKDANATRYLSNTGSSNNPAWAQVNLANGVTGNLPVTNLNSGTSASNTTFWRGDGTWAAPSGGGMTWSEVTGTSQAATVGNGYICNNAGLVTVTLPGTAAVGNEVAIQGSGAGGWNLTANTGQTIKIGNQTTSSAGSLASTNRYDAVGVICITANTTWAVRGIAQGNLTVA